MSHISVLTYLPLVLQDRVGADEYGVADLGADAVNPGAQVTSVTYRGGRGGGVWG